MPGQGVLQHGRLGLGVDGLEHQEHLELGRRVVERPQRLNEARQHVGLAEDRHQDGVDRQVPVGDALGTGAAGAHLAGWARQCLAQRDKPQCRHTQERQGDQRRQRGQRRVGQHGKTADQQPRRGGADDDLPARPGSARGACRLLAQQAASRPLDPLRAHLRLDRIIDQALGRHDRIDALPSQRHDMAEQDGGGRIGSGEHAARPSAEQRRPSDLGFGRVRRIEENELGIPGHEWHAEPARQRRRIVQLGDLPGRQQHLVDGDTAVRRVRLGQLQGGAVDERADQKRVLVPGRIGLGLRSASRLSVRPHSR